MTNPPQTAAPPPLHHAQMAEERPGAWSAPLAAVVNTTHPAHPAPRLYSSHSATLMCTGCALMCTDVALHRCNQFPVCLRAISVLSPNAGMNRLLRRCVGRSHHATVYIPPLTYHQHMRSTHQNGTFFPASSPSHRSCACQRRLPHALHTHHTGW